MMARALVIGLVALMLSGCSWLSGGQDENVLKAKEEADAANLRAKEARDTLAEVEARHSRGEATDGELESAKISFDERVGETDAAIARLDEAIKVASEKSSKLGSWGAAAGGVFGPVGAAIGGLLGTAGAAIMAWRKSRTLKSVLIGVQSARDELMKKNPDALALADEKLKEKIPDSVQDWIRKLKKKGVIPELPTTPPITKR